MTDLAPPRRRSGLEAEAALVLVTLLWGLSFPLMKNWQDAAGSCPGGPFLSGVTLITLRMALASVLVAAFKRRLFTGATGREHVAGAVVGLAFATGFALQTWGLAHTTPAVRSAFFTSLCSAWTPLFGWLFLRLRVGPLTIVGLAIGMVGMAFFVEDDWKFGFGDTLTLVASPFFAIQVLLLDRLGRNIDSARATPAFFLTTGVLAGTVALVFAACSCGVEAWLRWLFGMLGQGRVALDVGLMALLPTFLAFQLMNQYQPRLPACSRAALIYLLEPVFAALISVPLGFEPFSVTLLVGGGLILTGNVVVEIAGWFRARRAVAGE